MHLNKTSVFSSGDVSLELSFGAQPDLLTILSQTYYGTGGLKYRHQIDINKVNSVQGAHFFLLYVNGNPAGTFCLSKRTAVCKEISCSAFYGRYLSILPQFGGRGYGLLLKQHAYEYVKRTYNEPFMIYSFIEEKNWKSLKLSKKQGNRCIGTYEALSFSRISPGLASGFERMGTLNKEMFSLLRAFYESYSLVNLTHAGYGNNYFCIRKAGRIVAGVQATPVAWEIASLAGITGSIIMHTIPHIPFLNRLFNPKNYRFAAFEAIYVEEGYEADLIELLESTLSYLKLNSGLFFGDPKCRITRLLKTSGKLGLLDKVNRRITSRVMASFYNSSSFDDNAILYISGFDQT